MEEASLSNGQTPLDQSSEMIQERDGERTELDGQNGVPQGRKEFVALAVGMEFESYDDAYKYYICYAKEVGFRARVRVKNSWFKRMKEVNRMRKETRTGFPTMIRMRLVDFICKYHYNN
ncbi:hypothetical protein CsSME_00007371 [Camellia sinensis var. sinensis]